jgi:hypothetical protein
MIQSPVLIIGCPRSGTTLLFNILSEASSLWSTGYESKEIIEHLHHPSRKNWESGALDEGDLTPESRAYILRAFEKSVAPGSFWRKSNRLRSLLRRNPIWRRTKLHGQSGGAGSAVSSALPQQGLELLRAWVRVRNSLLPRDQAAPIRLLEKTPENCLRLPFLLALFPDARILYLTRDGRSNVRSLMEGWRQPHLFPGYRVPEALRIPGDTRGRWAFTLIPGWRDLVASPLEEVCAWQWIRCNEAVWEHRERTRGRVPYLTVRYESLVADPSLELRRIAGFAGVEGELLPRISDALPRINVVSAPEEEKWRRWDPQSLARILPLIRPMMERLGYESSPS